MKRFIYCVFLCAIVFPAMAAENGRRATPNPIAAARRVAPAVTTSMASMQVNTTNAIVTENLNDKSSVRVDGNTATVPEQKPEKDRREKECAACLQNNIGIGNTFVWASRYSNINDYSTMIEDTENPENNTCFVRVALKSTDSKIDLGDIRAQYYEMGRNITCGAWVDEDMLEKRILDAKKNARTWATVGGAVGGAALGVTSMELFGNRLIGGAVEGQKDKSLSDDELLRSQLLVLKKDNPSQYNEIVKYMKELQKECNAWEGDADAKPDACDRNFDFLLSSK